MSQACKEKKGSGRPFVIQRERATIALHSEKLSDPYSRRSFRYTRSEMEILINLSGPHYPKKARIGPNGEIPLETALMVSLRFCAGGSPYDIFPLFGIGYNSVYNCLWDTIRAINTCPDMKVEFPSSHAEQKRIARGFERKVFESTN